jgi:hypothetical protein
MYRKIVRRQIRTLLFILILALPSLLQATDGVRSDSAMIAYLQSEGVSITEGNRVRLLKSGEEKFDDLFVETGNDLIVLINEAYVGSDRFLNAQITCCGRTFVLLVEHPDITVFVRVSVTDLTGFIRRPVIDQDYLSVFDPHGLKERIKTQRKILFHVINRNDN